MAKRFYQPSTGGYVSQFVPDQLPAELMLKGIGMKQEKFDKQSLLNDELAAYKINALPGEDTRYAKTWKSKIDNFVEESSNVDLASPEFQRKYKGFVRDFKNDQGLQSVGRSFQEHQKALERIEELKKKGEVAAAREMQNDYNRRFGLYTAEEGLGYKGDVSLDHNLIGEGIDRFKEGIKFFEPLKESGSENAAFLESGVSYKNGWTGISNKRVKEQADNMFNDWATSAGGLQTAKLYDMQQGTGDYEISKLAADKKEEYQKKKDNFLKNEFLQIGRTVVHGKSTTNIDAAYNIDNKRAYDKELEGGNDILTGQLKGVVNEGNANLTWEQQIRNSENQIQKISSQLDLVNKNPQGFAPGTLRSLENKINEEKTKIKLIQEDKNKKYKNLYDLNYNKHVNKEDLNIVKQFDSKLDSKTKGLIEEASFGLTLAGYTAERSMAIGIEEFKKTKEYRELPESKKKDITDYQSSLNRVNVGKINAKKETEDAWKDYYYSGRTNENFEYTGVVTVPQHKGSTAKIEENLIKSTGGAGYSFYDPTTGKEITKTINTNGLDDFSIGAVTQGKYRGGIGKVGTITYKEWVVDPNNEDKKRLVTTTKQVIAVSRDPNKQLTNMAYAKDQFDASIANERAGRPEQAIAARREGMILLNPTLASKFDDAEKSQTYNSGPISFNTNTGHKIISYVDKLKDGTYNVTLKDKNGNLLAPAKNLKDSEAAKNAILTISLQ